VKIDYWFDPICPWCWLTSRWVATVAAERDLDVTWRRRMGPAVLERADVTLEHFTDELRESEADLDASSHRFFDAWIDTLGSTPENAPD
jgi:predicted DsbA family dithiol-disulfide isomerase